VKNYYINVFYSEVDEGYIADIPDLENCSAFGKTLQEALRRILIAQAAWLEAAQAEGKAVPPRRTWT
jgi:predicted RNase H-like HicB family nuclease